MARRKAMNYLKMKESKVEKTFVRDNREKQETEERELDSKAVGIAGRLYEKKFKRRLSEINFFGTEDDKNKPTSPERLRTFPLEQSRSKDIIAPDEAESYRKTFPNEINEAEAYRKVYFSEIKSEIKAQFLLEQASILCDQSKYADAVKVLDQPCVPHCNLLLPRLLLADCYIHLNDPSQAEKHINAAKIIVLASGLTHGAMMEFARRYFVNSSYARAVVLYRIACDLFVHPVSPLGILLGLFLCLSKVDDATRPLVKGDDESCKIGLEYGVRYMIEIWEKLKKATEVKPDLGAIMEGFSCTYIAINFHLAGEYTNGIKYCKLGLDAMELYYGSRASEHLIYGRLLHKIGECYFDLGKLSDAGSYYMRSIESCQCAKEFSEYCELQKLLDNSRSELQKTRERIRDIFPLGMEV